MLVVGRRRDVDCSGRAAAWTSIVDRKCCRGEVEEETGDVDGCTILCVGGVALGMGRGCRSHGGLRWWHERRG